MSETAFLRRKVAKVQQHSQHCDCHNRKYPDHDDALSDAKKIVAWPSLADEMIHLAPFQY
jgi:hypothetical protein